MTKILNIAILKLIKALQTGKLLWTKYQTWIDFTLLSLYCPWSYQWIHRAKGMALLLLVYSSTSFLWYLGYHWHKVQGMTNPFNWNLWLVKYESQLWLWNIFPVYDEIRNIRWRTDEKLLSGLLVLWLRSSSGTEFLPMTSYCMTHILWRHTLWAISYDSKIENFRRCSKKLNFTNTRFINMQQIHRR